MLTPLGADLLTLAGHKFYAPKGVGALYVRAGGAIEPIQYGAGHEHGLRTGTENVPHIVALGTASTSSACHAGNHVVSGVLAAMGLTREAAAGAVRLSLGRFTTETEIDRAAEALICALKSLAA